MIEFNLSDTFNKELPADPNRENNRRQVYEACFSFVDPRIPSAPQLVHVSKDLAQRLGLSETEIKSQEFLEIFSGTKILKGTQPYAMCYGGHQFGHWAGQLGDGRAINLFETVESGKRWAIQLKGAGETPYARSADGLAVLRSSIREHLCSEAMFSLGIPTTRSLSVILTGDQVLRDIMYNGNAAYEKGAVVCRVAPSFIRFGNFQIFTARKDEKNLKILTEYTIRHFFPEIVTEEKDRYIQFFRLVAQRTLEMVIHWQRVGFVHGVMNTDNMSILGLTIDYGPYGWLEGYDPGWTPNTTDRDSRRYQFGNQPGIALWNLAQLANTLFPLINDKEALQSVLDKFEKDFFSEYADMMRQKLGLEIKEPNDPRLIVELENTLKSTETDMTIFFRLLAKIDGQMDVNKALAILNDAFYQPGELKDQILDKWMEWLTYYLARLRRENQSSAERKDKMNKINPKYVLRNYMAQIAIDKAEQGDYSIVAELYDLLTKPYDEQPEQIKWFSKRPEWARHKIGCSMLSCSS